MSQWPNLRLFLAGFLLLVSRTSLFRPLPSSSSSSSSSSTFVYPQHQFHQRQKAATTSLSDTSFPIMEVSPLVVAGVAIGLGVAAQGFINQMLQGDQGLGAFLKDGSGYNKSGFRSKSSENERDIDPLPWLKLPQLDFVEVAGQSNIGGNDEALVEQLESLRVEMNAEIGQGHMKQAESLRNELETLMKETGIEYTAD